MGLTQDKQKGQKYLMLYYYCDTLVVNLSKRSHDLPQESKETF